MMTEILTQVKLELEEKRQVIFARKQELLNEAEAAQLEIDQLDIRLHTVEDIELRCQERLISCVAAPADNQPTKDYVDEVAEIDEKADKPKKTPHIITPASIDHLNPVSFSKNGVITIVESPAKKSGKHAFAELTYKNTIAEKTGNHFHIRNKNKHGLPDPRTRLDVSHELLLGLVNVIHARGNISKDDIDGIGVNKKSLLFSFIDDYAVGDFGNIILKDNILYWDES